MKSAKNWTEFSIVATGDGEKLEKWGDIYLLRPDPQVIWKPPFELAGFRMLNAHYKRSQTGGGAWEQRKSMPDEWIIGYNNLKFIISPTNFKHTGLFPEQATNWEYMGELIVNRRESSSSSKKPPPQERSDEDKRRLAKNEGETRRVLNLFGYTGGATVACAYSGAHVTHVDASKGMTDVCKRNVELNKIPSDRVRYIVDDCAKFVARELRRGKTYDAIIMDPPSFGRGANGEVWKLETCLDDLVHECCKLLSDKPLFFLINSYTTGLQPTVMQNILLTNLRKTGKDANLKHVDAYEVGLPTLEDLTLPCGCSSMAIFK